MAKRWYSGKVTFYQSYFWDEVFREKEPALWITLFLQNATGFCRLWKTLRTLLNVTGSRVAKMIFRRSRLFSQDLWGFYNGAPNQFLIPPMSAYGGPPPAGLSPGRHPLLTGWRTARRAIGAVLNKITYPQADATFNYESNTVSENPHPSQYAYNGIPYGETVIEYPIVPKTVPTGGGGTLREEHLYRDRAILFHINSRQRISERYGKMARLSGYLPGTTDAGPYEIVKP